jgi:membrane protein YdbS with pleckstrin-like domain
MLETASIAGGAVASLLLACIVGLFVYLKNHNKKCEFEVESQKMNHHHDIIKLRRCEGCKISDQFTIVIKYHNG